MPNSMTMWNKLDRSGDVMTGDLNLGLHSLILTDGASGARLRGEPTLADYLEVRTMNGGGRGSIKGDNVVFDVGLYLATGPIRVGNATDGFRLKAATGQGQKMSVRDYDDSADAAIEVAGASFSQNVTLAAGKTVDGRDISAEFADLFGIKADDGSWVSHTGTTAETVKKTYTVPAGVLGTNGSIRVTISGKCTGGNGTHLVKLRFGGQNAGSFTFSTGQLSDWWAVLTIHNDASASAQKLGNIWCHGTSIVNHDRSSALSINTGVDVVLDLTVTLGSAADTTYIKQWTVEVNPA